MAEPVVVVGHGAVTCLGHDMDSTWKGLVEGRSGLTRCESMRADRYLQNIAGLVDGFGPGSDQEDPALSRLGAKFLHLALAAGRSACLDAGLNFETLDRDRVALVVGSAFGGLDLLHKEQEASQTRKRPAVSPYLVPGMIINQATGQIAEHLGLYGPSIAPANACASGGHALALGAILIRSGEADLALCGAAESAFLPAVVNGFATMKALFPQKAEDRSVDDPAQASRPFSVDRSGFVMSEGAGMVLLASTSAAQRLGLRPQAELLSWSWNSDGRHITIPDPDRVATCLAQAISKAGLGPQDIDYYNAHGTSTILNDRIETGAIKTVFGDHASRLPVSSIKGALGHSLGAASAIEAAVCVRALQEQIIPPTIHYQADPELDLDYVPDSARPAPLKTVLSASLGFGGTNNALIFRRVETDV
ncbi:MAG TPA: beta-ketoacyl-[acyl-carrier-protein] synthase family protein [Isosphaeraceae bacterium]|nr:beta-ketoacyl-[acyl-carrier-protein] synthase family protein [Isosphaeraceae bacterium]